jgi:hypothetical protein
MMFHEEPAAQLREDTRSLESLAPRDEPAEMEVDQVQEQAPKVSLQGLSSQNKPSEVGCGVVRVNSIKMYGTRRWPRMRSGVAQANSLMGPLRRPAPRDEPSGMDVDQVEEQTPRRSSRIATKNSVSMASNEEASVIVTQPNAQDQEANTIDKIFDSRRSDNGFEYAVQRAGRSYSLRGHDSWQPLKNVVHLKELTADFHEKHPWEKAPTRSEVAKAQRERELDRRAGRL